MEARNIFGPAKTLISGFGVFLIVVVATYLIVPVLIVFSTVGIFIGGANAIYNYVRAFKRNIKLERV